MKGIYVDNLAIIVTEKCNMDCAHCLRGHKTQKSISKPVIDAIFTQIKAINLLNICGGEPFLAKDEIGYLFKTIIEKRVFIRDVYLTTNGTLYDPELMDYLTMMDNYIKGIDPRGKVQIGISLDEYHALEMKKYGLTIREELSTSRFFAGYRTLDKKLKVFREGNAILLPSKLTVPFRPMTNYIMDFKHSKYIAHLISPLLQSPQMEL